MDGILPSVVKKGDSPRTPTPRDDYFTRALSATEVRRRDSAGTPQFVIFPCDLLIPFC